MVKERCAIHVTEVSMGSQGTFIRGHGFLVVMDLTVGSDLSNHTLRHEIWLYSWHNVLKRTLKKLKERIILIK